MQVRKLLPSAAAAFTVALVATAQATPIMYQESVSGDLPANGSLPTFTLDIGTNTVSGTFGAPASGFDLDSFAFIVPVGTVLSAGSVTLVDAVGDITSSAWRLYSGSSTSFTGTRLETLNAGSPGSATLFSTPLGAETYNFSHAGIGSIPPALANYTFSLTLSPLQTVPEPGSLALMGAVLLGLTATKRRRSKPRG